MEKVSDIDDILSYRSAAENELQVMIQLQITLTICQHRVATGELRTIKINLIDDNILGTPWVCLYYFVPCMYCICILLISSIKDYELVGILGGFSL